MSDVDEMVAFLLAQYDEDEQVARDASSRSAVWRLTWPLDEQEIGDAWDLQMAEREHAERHDPASVLADIAAKRRIVFLAQALPKLMGPHDLFDNNRDAWAEVLKQLALRYASRDGYKDSWRP